MEIKNNPIKSAIIHGIEAVAILAGAWFIDYSITSIIPLLPETWQPMILTTLVPVLGAIAKWLRASVKSPVPDYVNKTSV